MVDRFTLALTADVHGHVGPLHPLSGQPDDGGLARIGTLLAELRARRPEAIYLDLGDLIQGSPLSYRAARERPTSPHPLVRTLNRLGCAGMVVGNHEFNFGLEFLEAMRRHAEFPLLAANVLDGDGEPFFEPTLFVERNGKRLAILGLTTPQVPRWEEPWHIDGLTFRDCIETARDWVPRLRREADAVVVAAHTGWSGVSDGSATTPLPLENAGEQLARIPGVDLLLLAHSHRRFEHRGESGALVVQPGCRAELLGEVDLTWGASGSVLASYQPRVAAATVEPDPAVLEDLAEDTAETNTYLDEVLATATAPFELRDVAYADNAILSLFHRALRETAGTDLSSTALFRSDQGLAAGPIRRRDLFRIYPFENDLTVLELTADDVRAYLEETARIYARPEAAARRPSSDGHPPLDAQVPLFHHDTVAGAEYVVDPSRPFGNRIVSLTFGGVELPSERRLTLAISSYRAQGGGGYAALGRAQVIERTGREIRVLLEEWLRAQGRVDPVVLDHWSLRGLTREQALS